MEFYARKAMHKGIEAVELAAGGYYAVVAPQIGTNVLRLRDNEKGIEVFRYKDDTSIAEIMNSTEVWGLPTLYLPNRFDGGLLKTSDGEYHLPVNEGKFGNHIHGFLQKRAHKITALAAEDGKAYVTTEFVYDESDFFFTCFPVKFTARITIELSENGMKHTISLTNDSDKMLPISIATHTTINAPFVDGGKLENIRLQVPAVQRIIFDKRRWLPTGEQRALDKNDKKYSEGTKCPVLRDICNDMFTAGTVKLDGEDFHGCVMTDTESGKRLCYETDENYKFWIIWNDRGFKNYFCPEPMTAQVNAPNLDMPREESGYTEISKGETYTATQRFFTK